MTITFTLNEIKDKYDTLLSEDIGTLHKEHTQQLQPLFLSAIRNISKGKISYDFFETRSFNTYLQTFDDRKKERLTPTRQPIHEIIYLWNNNIFNLEEFTPLPIDKDSLDIDTTNAFAYAYREEADHISLDDQIKYANVFLNNSKVSQNPFWIQQIHKTITKLYFQDGSKPDVADELTDLYKKANNHRLIRICLNALGSGNEELKYFSHEVNSEYSKDPLARVLLGELLIANTLSDLAQTEIAKALAVEINNPYGWRLLAACNSAYALDLLKKCVDENENHAIHVVSVIQSMLKKQASKHEGLYQKKVFDLLLIALKNNPDNEYIHYYLGSIYYKKLEFVDRDIQKSLYHRLEVLRINPNNWKAHNSVGLCLFKQGRLREAWFYFQFALAINPEIYQAHYQLAVIRLMWGDADVAIYHAQQAKKICSEASDVNGVLSLALFYNSQNEEAELYGKLAQDDSFGNITLGLIRLQQEVHDEAREFAEKARTIDPKNGLVYLLRGLIELDQKNCNKALVYFKKTIECDKNNAAAHEMLGNYYLSQNNLIDAYEYFQRAYELSPNNNLFGKQLNKLDISLSRAVTLESTDDRALIIRAEIAYKNNNLEEALEYYKRAISVNPKNERCYVLKAKWLLAANSEFCPYTFESKCVNLKNNTEALLVLGDMFMLKMNYKKAEPYLLFALERSPNNHRAHFLYGLNLIKIGRIEQACFHFNEALYLNPDDDQSLAWLSIAQFKIGLTEEGVESATQALVINPCNILANEAIGTFAYHVHDLSSARDYMKKAIESDPNSQAWLYKYTLKPTIFKKCGQVFLEWSEDLLAMRKDALQSLKEAYISLRRAVEIDQRDTESQVALQKVARLIVESTSIETNDDEVQALLAQIYLKEENLDQAKEHANKALDLNPKNDEALLVLAKILEREDDTDSANKYVKIAVETNPKNYEAHLLLGSRLFHENKWEEAEKHLLETTKLDRWNDTAYGLLGLIHAHRGNLTLMEAERALSLNPENDNALTAYAIVYLHKCEIEKASLHCLKALKLNKNNPSAQGVLIDLCIRGAEDGELELYLDDHGHIEIANALIDGNNIEKALYHVKKALELNPENDEAQLLQTQLLLKNIKMDAL